MRPNRLTSNRAAGPGNPGPLAPPSHPGGGRADLRSRRLFRAAVVLAVGGSLTLGSGIALIFNRPPLEDWSTRLEGQWAPSAGQASVPSFEGNAVLASLAAASPPKSFEGGDVGAFGLERRLFKTYRVGADGRIAPDAR